MIIAILIQGYDMYSITQLILIHLYAGVSYVSCVLYYVTY